MEFLKVLPADIARVGADGACILALIRFETAVNNEHGGRHICDGAMWWQAAYARIGEALGGVHPESVRRTISKLVKLGELLSCVLIPSHDQTKAYRCSEQSVREIDRPLSSQSAKSTDTPSESTGGDVEIDDCTILSEVTEVTEEEPPYPPLVATSQPLTPGVGKALQRANQLNATARSLQAQKIAELYSASLLTPVEPRLLAEIAVQLDRCLTYELQSIADGLQNWTFSDSWSPTQIPKFIHKAANRRAPPKTRIEQKTDDIAAAFANLQPRLNRNGKAVLP